MTHIGFTNGFPPKLLLILTFQLEERVGHEIILSTKKIVTVMFGPLSLVNHECKSNTGFTTTRNENYYKSCWNLSSTRMETSFPLEKKL